MQAKRLLSVLLIISCAISSSGCNKKPIAGLSSSKTPTITCSSTSVTTSKPKVSANKGTTEEDEEGEGTVIGIGRQVVNIDFPLPDYALPGLTPKELATLRNAVYAKHGYVFTSPEYRDFFSTFSWYNPTSTDVENLLTPIDKENINKILAFEDGLIYINENCRYELTFPERWKGYYKIEEQASGTVSINFYGKSKTGTISLQEYGVSGLPMFMIMSEPAMKGLTLDSVKKIGTSNGINYYHATPTDFALGKLFEISSASSAFRQTAKFEIDDTELRLAKEDWTKVNEMLKDVDMILKSFKSFK